MIAAALTLALTLVSARGAFSACPASSYDIAGVPAAADSSAWSDTYSYTDGYGNSATTTIEFDILAATLDAQAGSSVYGQASGDLVVVEDFTVVGPTPGTPLTIQARLRLDGDGGASGGSTASVAGDLRDDLGHIALTSGDSFHGELTLPVDALAGQPFHLAFHVHAESFGDAGTQMRGTFSFSGLPADAAVVSCRGYVSDPQVPVRSGSWGALKTRYR